MKHLFFIIAASIAAPFFFSNIASSEIIFSEQNVDKVDLSSELTVEERLKKLENRISDLTGKIDQILEKRKNISPTQDIGTNSELTESNSLPSFVTQDLDNPNSPEDYRITPEKWYHETVFNLLYEGEYEKAEGELSAFLTMYNKHPLAHNVHYWLGEINYTNKKYKKAQKEFMSAYALNPKGEKGPESLLKMALSYSALSKPNKACAALSILFDDFPNSNVTSRVKTGNELSHLNCEEYTDTTANKSKE